MAAKRFSPVAMTAPTAGETLDGTPVPVQAVETVVTTPNVARRHEVTKPISKGERIAFTWRLTPEQADQLDTLVLDLRRQLGRGRLGRAEMLQAMVDLVSERPDIQTDLVKRLDV